MIVRYKINTRAIRKLLATQRPLAFVAIAGIVICGFLSVRAQALVVGSQPLIVPDTTVGPANYPGWSHGDPGWYNMSLGGGNFVYLGDGWVLSARHVGYNAANGITFQTMLPNGSLGPVSSFHRIPGDHYYDYTTGTGNARQYVVSNPMTVQSETGQTISLADSIGGHSTDLELFRINGDPGLPSAKIASQPLPSNFTRAGAPEVVTIGRGNGRQFTERYWNVTENSQDDWDWEQTTTPPGEYQGYFISSDPAKRFGTNRLTDPRPNGVGDPSDPGAIDYTDDFEAVISDTRAVLELETNGTTRDVVSLMVNFNPLVDTNGDPVPGATVLETQGVPGDSGSGVFYKRGNDWELVGIVNAVFRYTDQPGGNAMYGNATLISDLSFYNQDHTNSIYDIIDSHQDYSTMGDINLDGVVSGNGTGLTAVDDVAAFVAGWGYVDPSEEGTITSWKNGDLNRDGKTDVHDFLELRGVLNAPISSAVLTALFGSEGFGTGPVVPEPSSIVLGLLAAACLMHRGARRKLSR